LLLGFKQYVTLVAGNLSDQSLTSGKQQMITMDEIQASKSSAEGETKMSTRLMGI
jgi:hypothetical protein